jgi:hypothetical protein
VVFVQLSALTKATTAKKARLLAVARRCTNG